MALYKNNTGGISKIGLTCKQDTKDPSAIVYSSPGDSNILGIITQAVPKYAQCEIATSGVTKVFCSSNVVAGSVIRAQKASDNISRATCKIMKNTDGSYFKIGTALKSGKGLISCNLSLSYNGSTGAVTNCVITTNQNLTKISLILFGNVVSMGYL